MQCLGPVISGCADVLEVDKGHADQIDVPVVEYAMEAIKVSFRDPDFAADQHKLATTAAAFPCANDSGTS